MVLSCMGMQDDPRLAGACARRLCAWSRLSERTQSDEAAGGRKARTAPSAEYALHVDGEFAAAERHRTASSRVDSTALASAAQVAAPPTRQRLRQLLELRPAHSSLRDWTGRGRCPAWLRKRPGADAAESGSQASGVILRRIRSMIAAHSSRAVGGFSARAT